MIRPSPSEFQQLAGPGRVVPLVRELPADLETPLSVYLKLRGPGPAFLLESVEKGETMGRYSFLGNAPSPLMKVERGAIQYQDPSGVYRTGPLDGKDPVTWLKELMGRFQAVSLPDLPGFWGGAVGYLGYDVVRSLEKLPEGPPDDLDVPEACFLLCRQSVLFDHVGQRMYVVVAVPTGRDPAADYESGCRELEVLVTRLKAPLRYAPPPRPEHRGDPAETFNRSREDFERAVERAREHIAAGDIFQVVLSQRMTRKTWADPVSIYRALRILNPSPYMFLLELEGFQLIGSSPEMLVKLENGVAENRPIAGTRRRGSSAAEDERLSAELLADPKERAEHVMLVDLGRNDLGRVCRYGTVTVPRLMEVERYSHVIHLVSRVCGEMGEGRDGFDLVKACFPAGTVSGAPKIRAMEIIDELEPTRRGPYAGAVGYFSFWGSVDTCIAIRTLLMKGDRVYLQAGAGLVADSVPSREYEETLEKLAALRRAVELAEGDLL